MRGFLMWALIFLAFIGAPLVSAIWFFYCLSSYKSTVPFTPEHNRKKIRAIVAGIIAGIFVGAFVIIVFVYGFTQFLVF